MNDKELFTQLLERHPPWSIVRIDLSMEKDGVDVYVEWPGMQEGVCPECGHSGKVHDRIEDRV